ncbi:uncharacterized protein (DUF2336 family) [Rhodothalassium salexigens DSM 2132]|uniref:Uncharacterized protein (DUF2336 family) n=1 Tax=Rhodothalassium salexigens DSM 2132 TaxID=1188247 RepID=A0A4R2PBK2_RHOSA|nr:hypothetical protein [Rhodothalassium salexigens DSM 2132]TCP31501.1 uncharacterized protein (DUF2336 family) [Rhodothalassium salexigens DSM 2132]
MVLEWNSAVDKSLLDRVVLAQKVGAFLSKDDIPRDQRRKVENFALMLAHDVSAEVRQCLAFELRRAPDLPRSLVMMIVRDIADVSVPFVKSTEVFTDDQWIEILDELEEQVLNALAGRPSISEPMAFELVCRGGDETVSILVGNRGAAVSERVCNTVIDRFSDHRVVLDTLAQRGDLPQSVAETLVALIADAARAVLVDRYGISPAVAGRVAAAAADRALVGRLAPLRTEALLDTVRDLRAKGQLDDALILAALEREAWRVIAAVLAVRSATPLSLVEATLSARRAARLDTVMAAANLAPETIHALRRALGLSGSVAS